MRWFRLAARRLGATLSGVNAAGFTAELFVSAGGSAVGLTVGSGGFDFVFGMASNTTVISGGQEIVESGGTTISATLDGIEAAGLVGVEFVSAGGSAIGLVVSSGGDDVVVGTASNTTVFSGGEESVSAGGTTIGATISGGAQFDGGFASNTTLYGDAAIVRRIRRQRDWGDGQFRQP